ncbi:hypothetical protein ACSBR2_014118 [Camellia fascicularis]
MDTTWFKFNKTIPKNRGIESEKEKEKETLNAFHIISLSEGFDLSLLFEERNKEVEMRFATAAAAAASRVIERMEEVGKAVEFSVRKSESNVRLVGNKGVTAAFTVVEVKKGGGNTFEYNQFCATLRYVYAKLIEEADDIGIGDAAA